MAKLFSRKGIHDATHHPRQDGMDTAAHRGDPYRQSEKLAEPAVCPDCQASYHRGRWSWDPPAAGATPHRCPACMRIRDGAPAGLLRLDGTFLARPAGINRRLETTG